MFELLLLIPRVGSLMENTCYSTVTECDNLYMWERLRCLNNFALLLSNFQLSDHYLPIIYLK